MTICNLTPTSACLKIPFTKAQTADLDKATGILFGLSSQNPLSGCKQTIAVTANASDKADRAVSVTGSTNNCEIDVNSPVGNLQLLVTNKTTLTTKGDQSKFAMAPSTPDTATIKLPNDDWQAKYGGRVLAVEGTQAYSVITTENGCIRLERFH